MFAYRMGRDYGIDAEVIMTWPLKKIYGYMSFYITETDKFKKADEKDKVMSFDDIVKMMEADGVLHKNE